MWEITSSIHMDALLFIGTLIFVLYKYLTWNFNYWQKRNIPYLPPTPFFGNIYDVVTWRKSIGSFLDDVYMKMPGKDFFGIWILRTPALVIRSPELTKMITVKDANYFLDRGLVCDHRADPVFSNVMFIAKVSIWRGMRTKTTPMFTTGKLRNMIALINECANDLKAHVIKVGAGKSIETRELIAKFSTDVLTSCAFGIQGNCFKPSIKDEDAPFRAVGRTMFEPSFGNAFRALAYFLVPSLATTFRVPFFNWNVTLFCRKVFWQVIREREKTGTKRNDIIDSIIDVIATKEIEGDAAVSLAAQFFGAGFETTSSTISFTLYELAINQKCQERLRDELKDLIDGKVELNYETLKGFKYLKQVVNESLRKFPVLPFLMRRCVQNYNLPNSDLFVEQGTPVYIPISSLHYDEDNFENPKIFDPDRFSEENISKIKPYTYLPFGAGPRNCIGERFGLMVSEIGVAHVISNFYVELDENTPKEIGFDPLGFVLIPNVHLNLKFTPIRK